MSPVAEGTPGSNSSFLFHTDCNKDIAKLMASYSADHKGWKQVGSTLLGRELNRALYAQPVTPVGHNTPNNSPGSSPGSSRGNSPISPSSSPTHPGSGLKSKKKSQSQDYARYVNPWHDPLSHRTDSILPYCARQHGAVLFQKADPIFPVCNQVQSGA